MPDLTQNMDNPTAQTHSSIAEGFRGQKLSVLPRPRAKDACTHPILTQLLVTDCGYYPQAAGHGFSRPNGCEQTVLILCTSGRGTCSTTQATFQVTTGDMVILPANHPHSYKATWDDPWTIWWMHVTGDLVADLLRVGGMSETAPVMRVSDLTTCAALLREVVDYHCRDTTDASLMLASSAALRLLALLATHEVSHRMGRSPVMAVTTHLQEHPESHLTLAEMASLAGLSPSRFSAVFREHTGTSPLRYQVAQRMRAAREYLDLTDTPITEIAQQLGYEDQFYFTRQFTKEHGLSPRNYRQRGKG